MESGYFWKMAGLAHGVDPTIVVNELRRLQDIHGTVTPELIVNEAKDDKSILHPFFEWNDKQAAIGYRLQQARKLLNNIHIRVLKDGEVREIAVFEVTTFGEGYKNIETFTQSDVRYIKMIAKKQLEYLKIKLLQYDDFRHTVKYIGIALSSLDEVLFDIEEIKKQPIDLSNKN